MLFLLARLSEPFVVVEAKFNFSHRDGGVHWPHLDGCVCVGVREQRTHLFSFFSRHSRIKTKTETRAGPYHSSGILSTTAEPDTFVSARLEAPKEETVSERETITPDDDDDAEEL